MIGSARSGLGSVRTAGESRGGSDNPSGGGFLDEIYAAGLADDPDVHNVMAGSYWQSDWSDADGRVTFAPIPSVRPEGAADYGRAPIHTQRYPEAGWSAHHQILEAHFASSIFGGTSRLHRHTNDATTDTLSILLDDVSFGGYGIGGAVVTRQLWRAAVGTGGGSSELIHLSDGMLYQDVTGTNSPATLRARQDGLHNPSLTHLGTEVSWLVSGWSSSLHLQPELSSIRSVLDDRNSGSGAVEAHWDFYVSTIAGGPDRVFSMYADGAECVYDLTVAGAVLANGGMSVNGTAQFFDPVAFDDDVTVAGDAEITAGAAPTVYVTPTIDFLATGLTAFTMPLRNGRSFVVTAARTVIVTRDAALSTAPTIVFSQNGASIQNGTVAMSMASINGTPALPSNIGSHVPAGINVPDLTTHPIQINVTVAGAGGGLTTLTGYVAIEGFWT